MNLAVETADIVHSTTLNADVFNNLDKILNGELSDQAKINGTHWQRFRGDSYQIIYPEPIVAIKCALQSRLRLMFDVYNQPILLTQSLAVGAQSINEKMGDVAILSGRQLDKNKRGAFTVVFKDITELTNEAFSLSTMFLSDVLNNLTQKQAECLYWYLKTDFSEHHIIAKKLNTTRQNVSIHLTRAKAELIRSYISAFQRIVTSQK